MAQENHTPPQKMPLLTMTTSLLLTAEDTPEVRLHGAIY